MTYLGHSTFLVEADGKRVIIDPFLDHNPKASMKAADVKVDAVLLTHAHYDHIADALPIAKANDCPIIANFELASHFEKQGVKTHGLSNGGGFNFEFGRVKLTLAFHGAGLEMPNGDVLYGGAPAGILLTMGGKTIYHAGDTGLFGDMKLIGELNKLDAALLPIGDNYTMGPEDAVLAASWLKAGVTVPMHYNTFSLLEQDPQAFVNSLSEYDLKGAALQPGESIEI
nr:metal-dependent hydrolase [Tumebacillus amylolyticus]